MNFGPDTDERDAHRILDEAVDVGINLVDTANVYGWSPNQGSSETIIGSWLAKRPGLRDRILLATKVYEPMGEGPNDRGLTAIHIREQAQASLRRLQTDRIDLYQFHHIDRSVSWEETWQATDLLVQNGQVIYTGSSNFPGWKIAQGNERAGQRGSLGLVTEQSVYNLLQRDIEREVLPAVDAYGMGVIAYSPLAGGILTGASSRVGHSQRSIQSARGISERRKEQQDALTKFHQLARDHNVEPSHVALAWVLSQPRVTAVLIGARRPTNLTSLAEAASMRLQTDLVDALERVWPRIGSAPEAYAW